MQLTEWGVSYVLSTKLKYICELHNKNVSFTGSFSGGPVGGGDSFFGLWCSVVYR